MVLMIRRLWWRLRWRAGLFLLKWARPSIDAELARYVAAPVPRDALVSWKQAFEREARRQVKMRRNARYVKARKVFVDG